MQNIFENPAFSMSALTTSINFLPRGIEAVHTALERLKTRLGEVEQAVGKANQTVNDATAKMAEAYKGLTSIVEANLLRQIEAVKARYQQEQSALETTKTLPVDADVSKAKEALDKLKVYADQNSQFELKVATEKAQAAIGNVERQILALDRIQTESRHQVNSNADAARSEILSLNGMNTSSTHTIYVRKVETNATGGLVGRGVRQFAGGGAVSPAFPRMSGGSVPGSGHHDTVPRTLEAGAFVIRKAAVQKYGGAALARLASGVARFAVGGPVRVFGGGRSPAGGEQPSPPKKNREAVEALKMIELGLQGMDQYTGWLQWNHGASVSLDMRRKTMEYWGTMARDDRRALDGFIGRKTLTGNERQTLERIKQNWRQAMAQPLLWGKDLERDLIDYMEQNQGEFYRRGGMAKSDSVPAMLTPGEYVVNKDAVARYGSGFFEAVNNLSVPARALAQRVQGFATGGLVRPAGSAPARPVLPADGTPSRTVRVELAAGDRKVTATVDARDESRLLQLLEVARARAV